MMENPHSRTASGVDYTPAGRMTIRRSAIALLAAAAQPKDALFAYFFLLPSSRGPLLNAFFRMAVLLKRDAR
jgi:hypothetical protein